MVCGFIGFAGLWPHQTELQWRAALATIKHRGPDATGLCHADLGQPCIAAPEIANIGSVLSTGPGLIFGHQRLKIIDLSEASSQPMIKCNLTLLFNGEIYNYRELRAELQQLGHHFESTGDTEVILASYKEWGRECVHRFRGMFAIALYDAQQNSLWLVRDRFAIKPLYVKVTSGFLCFASEPKAINALLGSTPSTNDAALYNLLVNKRYDSDRATFHVGIEQLLAGEEWLVDLRELSAKKNRYYALSSIVENLDPLPDTFDTIENYLLAFDESIKLHIRSDVPLGVCLSGGLDSSSIVATLHANHEGELTKRQQGVSTFTAAFTGDGVDERRFVSLVSQHTGMLNYSITPTFDEMLAILPKVTQLHDGPITYPSLLAQYAVFELAAGHGVKVLLDGQGGDEALGGYPVFILKHILELFRTSFFTGFSEGLKAWIGGDPALKSALWTHFSRIASRKQSGNLAHRINPDRFGHFVEADSPSPSQYHLNTARIKNFQSYPIPGLCKNEDRNSMAFGLESRVPLLDHKLVEFSLRLSPNMLFQRGLAKYALRKAMTGRLPQQVVWRRDKVGFDVPIKTWMGSMTYSSFQKRLLNRPRLAELFTGPNHPLDQEQWPSLTPRERFHLLAVDTWLAQN